MQPGSSSLERLVPDELVEVESTGHETLALHLERYAFAARLARPGRVLDMACGVGYGTRHLRDAVDETTDVVGVDLSGEVIEYARSRYGAEGIRFLQADALEFQDERGFDTVVSLETVEHVPDPERLADRLVALLDRDGVLVASVPTTPSVDVNPHHLTDFTERSYRRLFASRGLVEIDCLRQIQPFEPWAAVRRSEVRMADLRPNLLGYYFSHPIAAVKRAHSTLVHGFTNRYLTCAWRHR